MATVLPFDPSARRRTPARPETTTLPLAPRERSIVIPVEPSADGGVGRVVNRLDSDVPRAATSVASEPAELTDRALAMHFFPIVAAVMVLDLLTKGLAIGALGDQVTSLGAGLSLRLVYNTASAGGVWLGAYTRELNIAATGVVIGLLVMLVPSLARLDRRAPTALALIAGAGAGNLASLVTSDKGVPDFIAVPATGGAWVMNGADVMMCVGLLMMSRTILVMLRTIRKGDLAV